MARPTNVRSGRGINGDGSLPHASVRSPVPVGTDPFADINQEIDPLRAGHPYKKYKYEVYIGSDGSIQVQKDDWLSKYSFAIHGNPWQVNEYARRDLSGRLQPITNVDLIIAGETIYHIPSIPQIVGISFTPIAPTEDQQRKAFLNHLRNAEKLNPEYLETISEIMKTLDTVSNIAELLTVAEGLSALSRVSSVAGTFGKFAGPVGLALMPVGFAIDIANAVSAGRRGYANRAIVEATVAWVFDRKRPQPGGHTLDYIKTNKPQEVPLWEAAWNDSVNKTYKALEKEAIRRVKPHIVTKETKNFDPVLAYKLMLRVVSNNDPNRLRHMLSDKLDFYGGGSMSKAADEIKQKNQEHK